MSQTVDISPMSVDDLSDVLGWAAAEGWNPGLADAAAFHAADPQGFFLARINGAPVAAISVVNHGDEDAFLGLYLCRPDWRGQGIGMAVWRHAIEHAGDRSIGLDGVAEQEGNYRLSGFVRVGSSLRYEGRWPVQISPQISPAEPGDIETLIALDAQAGGIARPAFMRAWATAQGTLRGSRVLRRNGQIAGFATWRACQDGTKIGPVIAPDAASALELVADIASLRPDGPLIIDVPDSNSEMRSQLEAAGFEVSFATARMYRGRPPQFGSTLQAIATMELG